MNKPEIFVSYAWKGASEALVDQLCAPLAAKGYQIIRDKSAMTYKDSIKDFMDRIGRGKFIIAVVSDKYMKSEYCMYEAYRMFQSPAFRERVFPIVLPDADVFTFRGQAAYLKYWVAEYEALEKEYKSIAADSPTMVAPLTERLRDIEATTRFINDFMSAVGDMNVLSSQTHLDSNFSQLINAIETRMQSTDAGSTQSEDNQTQESHGSDDRKIDTSSDARAGGNVSTGGRDFVRRDKNSNNVNANIHIGGSVSGSNIILGNNNVVKQQIQNSFNKAEAADLQAELKETLKQLAQAVEAMNKALPQEQAADAADDLSKLVEEATKPNPNKKWYSVSIDGLIKAAENVEKLGEPVINLSRKVLSLLMGGVIK